MGVSVVVNISATINYKLLRWNVCITVKTKCESLSYRHRSNKFKTIDAERSITLVSSR